MTTRAADELLNAVPGWVFSFTDAGTVVRANEPLLEALGYPHEQVVGQPVERLLTIGSRIFYQTHWFPLLRLHGRAEEVFLSFRSAAGENIGALVNAARGEHQGEVVFHCVALRVRERQKYEDELLRARRVAESARAELEVQKSDLEEANRQLEEQAVELELQQQQLREQASQLEAVGDELRALNADLVARTHEAEHLRSVAEEASQAKSAFLAVMSHELRTPLNAIAGYVEILELGIHGPLTEAQRDSLGRISRSGRHLLRLINEVLNLARVEAGHVTYALEDVLVSELVSEVVPMIEPQASAKRIAMSVAIPEHIAVRADREKAQQILLNLLGNAVKFTPPGGSIAIGAELADHHPGHAAILVADTGIGIPSDKVTSIFQPFVQVDTTPTRAAEGTGLGLAISRDLARGMGGDLDAESAPGEGSVFTLTLPLGKGREPRRRGSGAAIQRM